jgi:CHAT domain
MNTQWKFIPVANLYFLRGNFQETLAQLERKAWNRLPWLAVAFFADFNGRWYLFDRGQFTSMTNAFLQHPPSERTVNLFAQIFDIHEYKSAEETESPTVSPHGNPRLLLAADTQPQGSQSVFAGGWIANASKPNKVLDHDFHMHKRNVSALEGMDAPNSGAEADVPELQTRVPHVDFSPEAPLVDEVFTVEVYADEEAFRQGEDGGAIAVPMTAVQNSVEIEVWLATSNGLRVVGSNIQKIILTKGQPRTTSAKFSVEWQAQADADAQQQVKVVFTYASRPCGWLTRMVTPGTKTSDAQGEMHSPQAAGVTPDMIITVVDVATDGQHFEVAVECPSIPAYQTKQTQSWILESQADEMMRAYVANFSAPDLKNPRRRNALDGVGQLLYDLAPQHFKTALLQLATSVNRPLTILIASEEPHLPWELMMPPTADGETALPLGARHVVGRWTDPTGRPPAQKVHVSGAWIISPNYLGSTVDLLKKQSAEAVLVATITKGEQLTPASYDTIEMSIKKSPRSLIHFVGHGAIAAGAMTQALLLDDADQLDQLQLIGMRQLKEGIRKGQSLIFLNACQSGQPIRSLAGGAGGLAATFLSMGASAVIAPLWSVRDEIAFIISESIYEELKNGPIQLGELLRRCRARAYDGPDAGEDTFAAYCLYGDPCLTVALAGNEIV